MKGISGDSLCLEERDHIIPEKKHAPIVIVAAWIICSDHSLMERACYCTQVLWRDVVATLSSDFERPTVIWKALDRNPVSDYPVWLGGRKHLFHIACAVRTLSSHVEMLVLPCPVGFGRTRD